MPGMAQRLRLPTALAFTVVGVVGAATAAVVASCGEDKPPVDAGCTVCVYETIDNGNCPFPTCATGPDNDVCPQGCIPQPIA